MLALLGTLVVIGGLFSAVLVDLQALRPERYQDVGLSQRIRTQTLSGYRGSILDRDGFVLATSTPGFEVVADPSMIEQPGATAAVLAPVLGLEPSVVETALRGSGPADRFSMIVPEISDVAFQQLEALADDEAQRGVLSGVFVRRFEDRVYPNGTLARPIIGGVDPDENGTYGLEWQFDELMQGRSGSETIERGVFGSITGGFHSVDPAVEGHDLILTLDHRIQHVVEESLIEHCQETRANGAQAVVSDPRTGEILAMATVVRNENGTCSVPLHNATLVETFEPGSVLKIVTAAAAVEQLGMTQDTLIDVPASVQVGDVEFFEHGAGHVAAPYPMSQIISQSMNVGTIRLAEQLGKETLHDYLLAFGLGQPTGLEFRHEARGRVADPDDWYGSDLGSIPIGQGVTSNAVQLNAAYNVIANGGLYVPPTLVRMTVDAEGESHNVAQQGSRRVVGGATADEVTDMLVGVVEHETGTGSAAAVPGYSVAGKTGTAWKVFREGPDAPLTYGYNGNRRYIVSFAGFLPAENPQLSITVVVDEPQTDNTAGRVAAPVFADIAQYSLRILGIPPGENFVDSGDLVRGTPAPNAGASGITETAAPGSEE